jgi:hypothetical protein
MTEHEWNDRTIDLLANLQIFYAEYFAGFIDDLDESVDELGKEASALIYATGDFAKCNECGRAKNDCGCQLRRESFGDATVPF